MKGGGEDEGEGVGVRYEEEKEEGEGGEGKGAERVHCCWMGGVVVVGDGVLGMRYRGAVIGREGDDQSFDRRRGGVIEGNEGWMAF